MSPAEVRVFIDSITSVLGRTYVFPDKVALYSKKINSAYKSGAYSKTQTRTELGKLILADLQEANKDIHLNLGYFPEASKNLEIKNQDSIIVAEHSSKLAESYARNFYFVKKELLPGNVFYLRWDGFDGFTEEALNMFDTLFQQASQSKAVVIDLRYNGGGNSDLVLRIENYFFKERIALNHLITRSNDTLKRFTDPSKTDFKIEAPVYILTSRKTVSGAEDFTYALKLTKRATIIGDTTWGGAHPIYHYSLGQGFVMAVPTRRSFNEISRSNWEGTGIPPDIYSESEAALGKALELIYTNALSRVKNDGEKNSLLKAIDEVKKGKYLGLPFEKKRNVDAAFAIDIKDSIYGPTNVGLGPGAIMEYHVKTEFLIRGAPIFLKEGCSAWFKLNFDHDTLLTFDLVPVDPANDYDFIFFKCPGNDCVENIRTHKVKPDRECHSGFSSFNGATGLSEYSKNTSVSLGPGDVYASALPVKKGETYYLMVFYAEDYIKEQKLPHGFTLYFHNYWPKKKTLTLQNVNFNSNEAVLLQQSFVELDKLVKFMKKEKFISIEVKGHADSEGSEEKNIELSNNRAQAVKTYLCSKGIEAKRILCKGFGSAKPLTTNDTEEGRKKNRRVEFAVIMK